jgi:hypothetical protein
LRELGASPVKEVLMIVWSTLCESTSLGLFALRYGMIWYVTLDLHLITNQSHPAFQQSPTPTTHPRNTSSQHILSNTLQTLIHHIISLNFHSLNRSPPSFLPSKVLTAGGGSKNDMWTKMRTRLLQVYESHSVPIPSFLHSFLPLTPITQYPFLPSSYAIPHHATPCHANACIIFLQLSYRNYMYASLNVYLSSSLILVRYVCMSTLARTSLTDSGAHIPGYQRRCCLWQCKTRSQVLFSQSCRKVRATSKALARRREFALHLITWHHNIHHACFIYFVACFLSVVSYPQQHSMLILHVIQKIK